MKKIIPLIVLFLLGIFAQANTLTFDKNGMYDSKTLSYTVGSSLNNNLKIDLPHYLKKNTYTFSKSFFEVPKIKFPSDSINKLSKTIISGTKKLDPYYYKTLFSKHFQHEKNNTKQYN